MEPIVKFLRGWVRSTTASGVERAFARDVSIAGRIVRQRLRLGEESMVESRGFTKRYKHYLVSRLTAVGVIEAANCLTLLV